MDEQEHPEDDRDEDAAQRQDLVVAEVIAAKSHRGEGRDDGQHPEPHHETHGRDLLRLARAAAPHGDERPEAHEHAGDLGQRKELLGVLHVPPPPHMVIGVRMGARWRAVERRTTPERPVRVASSDESGASGTPTPAWASSYFWPANSA